MAAVALLCLSMAHNRRLAVARRKREADARMAEFLEESRRRRHEFHARQVEQRALLLTLAVSLLGTWWPRSERLVWVRER